MAIDIYRNYHGGVHLQMSNVYSIFPTRIDYDFQVYVSVLPFDRLFNEMLRFNDLRKINGGLTLELIRMGYPLFSRLKELASSKDMRAMCDMYLRDLDTHAAQYIFLGEPKLPVKEPKA